MAKKDYVRYINSLLNENTEQSKQELSDLFADEEFRKNDMLEDTRMGYMYIAICIYREEKAAHIEENILMNVDSLGEICDLICDIKFLLWRIEFQTESMYPAARLTQTFMVGKPTMAQQITIRSIFWREI